MPSPILAALASLVLSCTLEAATITYRATDLADTTEGSDLWRYDFAVSGLDLLTGQGFSIFFPFNSYGVVDNLSPGSDAMLSILAIQPDPALASAGFLDFQALSDSPDLSGGFSATFVWRGIGSPNAQPFTLYDTDFSTIGSGTTTLIPEPRTFALCLPALLAFLAARRRDHSGSQPSIFR